MLACDVMAAPVCVITPGDTVAHARNLMVKHRISHLPVMEGENLTGIITKKDLALRLRQPEPAWRRRSLDLVPVSAIANREPIVVAPDTGIRSIARLFVAKGISAVPVMEENRVTGIVTKTDLMKSALVANLTGYTGDIMEDVATVTRHHSLGHVIALMRGCQDKVIVAGEGGLPAGIITETSLALRTPEQTAGGENHVMLYRRRDAHGRAGPRVITRESVTAEDVMTGPVVTVAPDSRLSDAVALMGRHHINSLVVVQDNTIVGILKRDDLIREVAK